MAIIYKRKTRETIF